MNEKFRPTLNKMSYKESYVKAIMKALDSKNFKQFLICTSAGTLICTIDTFVEDEPMTNNVLITKDVTLRTASNVVINIGQLIVLVDEIVAFQPIPPEESDQIRQLLQR